MIGAFGGIAELSMRQRRGLGPQAEGLEALGGEFGPRHGEADLVGPERLVGFSRAFEEQGVVFVDGGISRVEADRFDVRDFGGLVLTEAGEGNRQHQLVPPFVGIVFGRPAEVVGGKDIVFPGIFR